MLALKILLLAVSVISMIWGTIEFVVGEVSDEKPGWLELLHSPEAFFLGGLTGAIGAIVWMTY